MIGKIIDLLISAVVAVIGLPTVLFLIFFIMFNGIGLIFGFEDDSPACTNYHNNRQTNWERYMFPIAPYACDPKNGLAQPHASNLLKWLGERNGDGRK